MLKCVICENENLLGVPELNKDLVRCNKCNLIFYNKINNISASSMYTPEFFETVYYNYVADKAILQKNFARRLSTIKKFIKNGKLLEIGSAFGFFLELAKKDFEVFGIDVAECGIKYARDNLGLNNIACDDYLNVKYKENYFDGICMFDTIEHLNSPHLYLEKANRELKTSGMLFLTTGDINSFMAKIQKHKWRLIKPPEHLYYFSYQSLKMLLEKYGFEVVYKTYPGYYRSLANIVYLTMLKKKNKFNNILLKFSEKIPIYLNLYDIMFIAARKKDTISRRI